MTDIAIKVSNLSKCYQIYDKPHDRLKQSIYPRLQRLAGKPAKQYHREFWALKDVSFEIKRGETVGIIGRNGSGKSTLLQMICGTLNPTGGNIQTKGRIAALLELGSGFNPEFTGRENVYMNAAVLGLSTEETDVRFDDIVAFADISDFIEQPVKTYSSGMMMRLAFAVAINVDPQILVVDEALSVGDELFQRKCFSRIESIKENGATILFVSHAGGVIIELCDRAILMDSGEKLALGTPKQIVANYQRLLYAPTEKSALIREQIRGTVEQNKPSFNINSSNKYIETTTQEPELQETFDQNLNPLSTTEYESRGAYIENPIILTMGGTQVNNLVSGRRYRYSYKVRFERGCTNVRFGMVVKTTTGVEIGGTVSAADGGDGITHVAAKTTLNICFEFDCILNPGTYYLNAGVLGVVDAEEQYLHRKLDAYMFRVLPIRGNKSSAIVNLRCDTYIDVSDCEVPELLTVDQRGNA